MTTCNCICKPSSLLAICMPLKQTDGARLSALCTLLLHHASMSTLHPLRVCPSAPLRILCTSLCAAMQENEKLSLPAPPHQRLLHRNRALNKGPIGAVLKDGDIVVAIGVPAPPPLPDMPSTLVRIVIKVGSKHCICCNVHGVCEEALRGMPSA